MRTPSLLLGLLLAGAGCESDGAAPTSFAPLEVAKAPAAERVEKKERDRPQPKLPSIKEFQTRLAFVPSIADGTISAVDVEKNEIAWTLKVSAGADERKPESAMGIAATRDGKRVFTGDVAKDEVIVVDADKREVIKRIPVGHQVHAVDIDPAGRFVWVAGWLEGMNWLSETTVIDAKSLEIVGKQSPGLGNAAHFAFTPDGKEVWAPSVSTNLLWVSDASTREVLEVIPLIPGRLKAATPEGQMGLIGLNEVAISPDGRRAYAVGPEAGVVFAVDVPTREVVGTVKVGQRTHGVGVTRDGKEVWTANNAGTVSVIDAETLKVTGEVDLREYVDELPFAHVAFSLDGSRAYLAWTKDLAVIDVASRKVATMIPFGVGPHEISLEDFYVAHEPERARSAAVAEGDSNPGTEDDRRRESNAAGITIVATLATPTVFTQSSKPSFDLAIDTHSGDIMAIDLGRAVELVVDGEKVEAAPRWLPESESSHHRKGTLAFNEPVQAQRSLELRFANVGTKQRTLRWDAPKAESASR